MRALRCGPRSDKRTTQDLGWGFVSSSASIACTWWIDGTYLLRLGRSSLITLSTSMGIEDFVRNGPSSNTGLGAYLTCKVLMYSIKL